MIKMRKVGNKQQQPQPQPQLFSGKNWRSNQTTSKNLDVALFSAYFDQFSLFGTAWHMVWFCLKTWKVRGNFKTNLNWRYGSMYANFFYCSHRNCADIISVRNEWVISKFSSFQSCQFLAVSFDLTVWTCIFVWDRWNFQHTHQLRVCTCAFFFTSMYKCVEG